MSEPDLKKDRDYLMVQKAAESLIDHFDNVEIFVSRHEPGEQQGTININYGLGNWFTRYGQVRNWIIREEQITKLKAKSDL